LPPQTDYRGEKTNFDSEVVQNRTNLPEFRNKDFGGSTFKQSGAFFDLEEDNFKPKEQNPPPRSQGRG